ncbi:MAG: PIN domain-containing protein [Synergistaceae bacterium]|jgi:predicted nucleic acid-binding protein|nr:PIN domain-containing protein [Synergistaceae bacterium]
MRTFVDANVFLRLFVEKDNPEQIVRSERLFAQARAGNIDLMTGPPVFFEIAWTLAYRYKVPNAAILDLLEAILAFPNLKVIDRNLVMAAIYLAKEKGGSFADSYIAASASDNDADNIATFNSKHFNKLAATLYVFEVAR